MQLIGERKRKGACRRADVPPTVMAALNRGEEETITLAEWLAIDMPLLAANALAGLGLKREAKRIGEAARERAAMPFTARCKAIGVDIGAMLLGHAKGREHFLALATHPSDMVRSWAAMALASDASVALEKRLEISRHFAADRSMAVRECAWDSFRGFIAQDLDRGLALLRPWVSDADAGIRRCAVEATRPRGVWCAHIEALKQSPEMGLALLEPVKSDSSKYVLTSASNWLNDASKSKPGWVKQLCARWKKESKTEQTRWLIGRAMRTMEPRKR